MKFFWLIFLSITVCEVTPTSLPDLMNDKSKAEPPVGESRAAMMTEASKNTLM
jgi:hypothetical protein